MGNGIGALILAAQAAQRRKVDTTMPSPAGGGMSSPADGGVQFNTLGQALQYFGDGEFPRGGGNYPAYQFGNIPGLSAQPAPLNQAGIPTTPMGPTPSQYSAPPSSGPYGLLAQQLAGIQTPQSVPDNNVSIPKQRGLLMM